MGLGARGRAQRAERVAREKEEEVKVLCEEMKRLEDVAYVGYEQGFNEDLTQVKHFSSGSMIDLSRVDWERKLTEILVEEAPTDYNV